jgi:DNA-binding MarR family transcriptional regulator
MTDSVERRELANDTLQDDSPFALGLLLRRALERTRTAMTEALAPWRIDLRHFAVMIVLANHDAVTQREIADIAEMDTGTMVRVVDDLEARGYARRTLDPADRRVRRVVLTESGRTVFEQVHEPAAATDAALTAHLASAESAALIAGLRRYLATTSSTD